MEIQDLINICIEKRIVCLVGGGGKTTLMYYVANEAAKAGKKVIIATTTHIMKPDRYFASNYDEVKMLWEQGNYAVIGNDEAGAADGADEADTPNAVSKGKIVFPDNDLYETVKKEADLILLEADGAKRLPCKVPAKHEPVILEECNLVIGVMGMSALGRPLNEMCFRFETDGKWLEADSRDNIDESIAVKILSSENGTNKGVEDRDYIVVLNQCDDEEICSRASKIADVLKNEHGIRCVLLTFLNSLKSLY